MKAYFDLEGQLAAISRQSVDLVMADAIRNPDVQRTNEASKRLIDHPRARSAVHGDPLIHGQS